jgi:hypothetical protein
MNSKRGNIITKVLAKRLGLPITSSRVTLGNKNFILRIKKISYDNIIWVMTRNKRMVKMILLILLRISASRKFTPIAKMTAEMAHPKGQPRLL